MVLVWRWWDIVDVGYVCDVFFDVWVGSFVLRNVIDIVIVENVLLIYWVGIIRFFVMYRIVV